MKIKYSQERSDHYGEPTWYVIEEDRSVTHEMPLSGLLREPSELHGKVAQNALRHHLHNFIDTGNDEKPPRHSEREPVGAVEAAILLAMEITDNGKPRDRGERDRHYAVLKTDLEKAAAWAKAHQM